jgi:hypothetical protein
MAGLKEAFILCVALAGAGTVVGVLMLVFDRRKLGKGAAVVGAA